MAAGADNPALELEENYANNNVNNDVVVSLEETVDFEDLSWSEETDDGGVCGLVSRMCEATNNFYEDHRKSIKKLFMLLLLVLYNLYVLAAIYHHVWVSGREDLGWCDGLGFLLVCTGLVYLYFFHKIVIKPLLATKTTKFFGSISAFSTKFFENPWSNSILYALLLASMSIFVILDVYFSSGQANRLISFLGLLTLVFLSWIFSKHPTRVVWRHVAWGLFLQFGFGLLILRWSFGKALFECLGQKVTVFLSYTDAGSSFVFGYLVTGNPFNNNSDLVNAGLDVNALNSSVGFVFMFKVLSVIYFFSFVISMLFHLGAMQWVVVHIGQALQLTMGTTACESLNAAANIFLGQSEAPLMIKPYLNRMTNSELHAVMTGGFATIAGSVLAAYISFNISASHLMSASVMSAPAALAAAKLIYPETKRSKTRAGALGLGQTPQTAANLLDAASQGAVTAVFLVANIGGTLVAVLAFIAFVNGLFNWFGQLVGILDLSLELLLGKIFVPLAFLMGVPIQDLEKVGTLVGLKTIVNEFAAYDRLNRIDDQLQPRSKIIATYALCGFANPASIGIQLASLATMAPERASDLARVALRAFVAGSVACFMTACVAGALID